MNTDEPRECDKVYREILCPNINANNYDNENADMEFIINQSILTFEAESEYNYKKQILKIEEEQMNKILEKQQLILNNDILLKTFEKTITYSILDKSIIFSKLISFE